MNHDDIAPGVLLTLNVWHSPAVPCTVVDVHREDDGVVSQIIVRREDTGATLIASKPYIGSLDGVSPGDAGHARPLEWLVYGGASVTGPVRS